MIATVIRIDDDASGSGHAHSLSITVWTVEHDNPQDQQKVARFLAVDFLERTLAAMKPESPVTAETHWRAEYAEADLTGMLSDSGASNSAPR